MEINKTINFQDTFKALNSALSGVEGVATVFGREKSAYSTKKKLEDLKFKGKPKEIFDLIAFTIIVNSEEDIRKVFEKLKSDSNFSPLGDHGTAESKEEYLRSDKKYTQDDWEYRVHNYIGKNAKPNGYSSFHCGFKYNEIPIEIHIETREMFMENNFGSADHNGVYKARPTTDTFFRDILSLFETLHSNGELKKAFHNLVEEHDNTENTFFNNFSELLKKFNINLSELTSKCLSELTNKYLSDEEIFEEISKVLNRYYLHELIILYANDITNEESLRKAYDNLIINLPPNFPLEESVKIYCEFLGIPYNGDIKENLIKCIVATNPVLYDSNLEPTTKRYLRCNLGSYSEQIPTSPSCNRPK